jgi:DNA-binding transcriptional ArsR family regulator
VETKRAIEALGALAQETRLKVFRLLVQASPGGMAAGSIAEKLNLPAATLSFHLAGLARAGLAKSLSSGADEAAERPLSLHRQLSPFHHGGGLPERLRQGPVRRLQRRQPSHRQGKCARARSAG